MYWPQLLKSREMGSNIESIGMNRMTTSVLKSNVGGDRRHLAGIIRRVRSLRHVLRINRTLC